MAMIDAYRIGVDLVLGGDLAAGLEALIPGLERLDTRIAHANAKVAALAAGLYDVAEAAPGIGRAADQMSRLSAAMDSVNKAVTAWRSHGGVLGLTEDSAGMSPHKAASSGTMAGLTKGKPDVVHDLGSGEQNGGRLRPGDRRLPSDRTEVLSGLGTGVPLAPRERSSSGLDAVMPALLAGELVKSNVAGRFDGDAKGVEGSADGREPDLASPVRIVRDGRPGADTAKGALDVYASAIDAVPVYARAVLGPARSGVGASFEPMLGGDLKSATGPGSRDFGGSRVEEVEEVMPTLTRRGHSGALGEVLVEPHPFVQQALPWIDDTLAPGIGVRAADMRVRQHVTGFDATPAGPSLALSASGTAATERTPQPHTTVPSRTLAASARDAAQGFGVATLNANPEGARGIPDGRKTARDGSAPRARVSNVQDGLAGLMAIDWHESLFTLTGGLAALKAAAALEAHAPGAVATGFVPSLTAPYRNQGGGMSMTPDSQGYHPRGDQPGPVIQHITYLHLDDREIARVVTRQQLRMMGGNVSGTLRPDPSLAPHYGAHLLET